MSQKIIRVGGVHEHFNTPWYRLVEKQPLTHENIEIQWKACLGGTGEMTQALRNNELDVAILLTEGIITDILRGNPSKIVQFYTLSPLIWGIHSHISNPTNGVNPQGKTIAISRKLSGSHLMAEVLAHEHNVQISENQWNCIQNLEGALTSLKNNESDLFLWEKYTTNPFVLSGELKRLGEIPTPWPAFVIAARNEFIENDSSSLALLLDALQNEIRELQSSPQNTKAEIGERFQLYANDVEQWFEELKWNTEMEFDTKAISQCLSILKNCGIIETLPNAIQDIVHVVSNEGVVEGSH
jgi:sulfonate transport system substrate-binding protein